jgi:hypothetical protein
VTVTLQCNNSEQLLTEKYGFIIEESCSSELYTKSFANTPIFKLHQLSSTTQASTLTIPLKNTSRKIQKERSIKGNIWYPKQLRPPIEGLLRSLSAFACSCAIKKTAKGKVGTTKSHCEWGWTRNWPQDRRKSGECREKVAWTSFEQELELQKKSWKIMSKGCSETSSQGPCEVMSFENSPFQIQKNR